MIKKYLNLCKENKKYLYLFLGLLLILAILELIIPVTISSIIDYLTIKNKNQTLFYIGILLILYITYNVIQLFTCKTYTIYFKNCFIDIHKKAMNKIYTLNDDLLSKIPKGRILNIVNIDTINIAEMADYMFDVAMNFGITIVIVLIFIKQNIVLGIGILAIYIIYLMLANKYTKQATYYEKSQREYTDKLIHLLSQTLNGLKDIQTSGMEKRLNKKYDYLRKSWGNKYEIRRKKYLNYSVNLKYLIRITKVFLYLYFMYLILCNQISIGKIILFISYYDRIFECAVNQMNSMSIIRRYTISLNRVVDLLNVDIKNDILYGDIDNDFIRGLVEFKRVSFSYKDIPTIKNINFRAEPNQITALVGHSGSGKTTIANLLLKLYPCNKGKILIDDISIDEYTKDVYSSNVSIVNQSSFLFHMSIKENLGMIDANLDHQMEVCKRVGIHDYIMSLPNGYKTVLSENGANFSGGQKQLLAIARTLLSKSEILIFDEVTSSLDTLLTEKIQEIFDDLKKDHTIIIITHKKEVMKLADKIIVLHKGTIVGEGTHHDLLKSNSYYKSLQISGKQEAKAYNE